MIFIDSGFLIGLFIDKDQWHIRATEMIDKIDRLSKKDKIISNFIIEEIITMIGSIVGAKEAVETYWYIHDNYTIINETKNLYDRSISTFLKYDGTLSLTDSVSVENNQNYTKKRKKLIDYFTCYDILVIFSLLSKCLSNDTISCICNFSIITMEVQSA